MSHTLSDCLNILVSYVKQYKSTFLFTIEIKLCSTFHRKKSLAKGGEIGSKEGQLCVLLFLKAEKRFLHEMYSAVMNDAYSRCSVITKSISQDGHKALSH